MALMYFMGYFNSANVGWWPGPVATVCPDRDRARVAYEPMKGRPIMDWTFWMPVAAVVLTVAALGGVVCLAHKNRYGAGHVGSLRGGRGDR
jgi:hypothetical protein